MELVDFTRFVFALGTVIGARLFRVVPTLLFRRICYALIAAAALLSLPVLDPILR